MVMRRHALLLAAWLAGGACLFSACTPRAVTPPADGPESSRPSSAEPAGALSSPMPPPAGLSALEGRMLWPLESRTGAEAYDGEKFRYGFLDETGRPVTRRDYIAFTYIAEPGGQIRFLQAQREDGTDVYTMDGRLLADTTGIVFVSPHVVREIDGEGREYFRDLNGGVRIPPEGYVGRGIDLVEEADGLIPAATKRVPERMEPDDSIRYGYLNRKGQWAIPPRYTWVLPFDGAFAQVYTENGDHLIIDRQGRPAPDASVSNASPPPYEGIPAGYSGPTEPYADILQSGDIFIGLRRDGDARRDFDVLDGRGQVLTDTVFHTFPSAVIYLKGFLRTTQEADMAVCPAYLWVTTGRYQGYIDRQGTWLYRESRYQLLID